MFLLCILIKEKVYKLYIFDFEEVQVENNEMKFMSNRSLEKILILQQDKAYILNANENI